jgi:hypothetical protein
MTRVVEKEVEWTDGGVARVAIRVWSHRDRDAHDRKFNLSGDLMAGSLIGTLSSPEAKGKELQMAMALIDRQIKRVAELGHAPVLDRVARCLVSVTLPDGQLIAPPAQWDPWLEELEAPLFDRIAVAVDQVIGLAPEAKKKSGSSPTSPAESSPTSPTRGS